MASICACWAIRLEKNQPIRKLQSHEDFIVVENTKKQQQKG